jgi:hypothetical protein
LPSKCMFLLAFDQRVANATRLRGIGQDALTFQLDRVYRAAA